MILDLLETIHGVVRGRHEKKKKRKVYSLTTEDTNYVFIFMLMMKLVLMPKRDIFVYSWIGRYLMLDMAGRN